MDITRKYLHDRVVLALIAAISLLAAVGISLVLLRFDISKNPTTIVSYRPSISGNSFQSGHPIDIYALALFMFITSVGSVLLGARVYAARRSVSIFLLAGSVLLLLLAAIVSNSLISLL